jgi:methyltransferase (TIGR00027 family)
MLNRAYGEGWSCVTDNADWDVAKGIGFTALLVAACRAIESHHEHPLVRDPYAAEFVRAAAAPQPIPLTPEEAAKDPSSPVLALSGYIGVRSRFLDEFLTSATTGDSAIRQVVLLAAGLDARALRLALPAGTTVYELDAQLVLEFKDEVLARSPQRPESARRRTVPADLRADWPSVLRDAGFDPALPTAWIGEGLLPYLPDDIKASVLAGVHSLSAPGSQLALEHYPLINYDLEANSAFVDSARSLDLDFEDLIPLNDCDPARWLAQAGWSVSVSGGRAVAEGYGRPLPPGIPESVLAVVLITARAAPASLAR